MQSQQSKQERQQMLQCQSSQWRQLATHSPWLLLVMQAYLLLLQLLPQLQSLTMQM